MKIGKKSSKINRVKTQGIQLEKIKFIEHLEIALQFHNNAMIIHYNHDKPTSVYVVNSRLSVYRAYYGDGLGNTILGLFGRIAPKVAPFAKQAGMKAIEVIRDKGIGVVGDLAGKAFSTVKNKIASLVRPKKQPLPSTAMMPAQVSKIINDVVQQKLGTLDRTANSSNLNSLIAGSGFNKKSRRRR